MRSSKGTPQPLYFLATLTTSLKFFSTSLVCALASPALEPAPIGGASECETSTDTPSFGEFSTLPDQGGCPCPHSNHTSSSPSGNSSKPCFRKGTPTTRSGATDPESPSVWSSRS